LLPNAAGAYSVAAADLDGDGDLDALSATSDNNTIAWYENHDNGSSFTPHPINTSASAAHCVAAADLDSDGDMDVLSASSGDNTIAWYENNGQGSFTLHVI